MATFEPRTPVLVGAGQRTNRVAEGDAALEPADLMAAALRQAATDTGAARPEAILSAASSIRVPLIVSWRHRNPGAVVARRLGIDPSESVLTVMGGNNVQALVNASALDILEGRHDVVLLTGAEAEWSRRDARRRDTPLPREHDDGRGPAATSFGHDEMLFSPLELERGLALPVTTYPLFENALRGARGWALDEHRDVIGRLWSRFSEVAAGNPDAWIRRTFTADELTTATAENRMVGFPYPKLLVSNNVVDQGAGLILCSAERATALGIPRERWVFVHAGSDAHDHVLVSQRADLCSSPAIRIAGRAALDLAGTTPADVAHVDLYSCFPSAVQIAAAELALPAGRDLTVTGGMTFGGGPFNNYTMHGIATMAGVLRADPGSIGLCTGNGGYLSKHSFGVYSTDPPTAGRFRAVSPQAEVDALPRVELDAEPDGRAEVETYTIAHGRDGAPERGVFALRMGDGRRSWGWTDDAATMTVMTEREMIGLAADVRPDGRTALA